MVRYKFWNLCKWLRLGDFFEVSETLPDTETTFNHTQTFRWWRWWWGRELELTLIGESMDRLCATAHADTYPEEDCDIWSMDRTDYNPWQLEKRKPTILVINGKMYKIGDEEDSP
jgi:hypothetical protein